MTQASIASTAPRDSVSGKHCVSPAQAQLFPDIPQVRELTRTGLNLCPPADAEGVRNVVALYRDELGSAITEAEAEAVLAWTMRLLWAINLPSSRQDADTVSPQNDSVSTTAQ
jgi:hypothetical protein